MSPALPSQGDVRSFSILSSRARRFHGSTSGPKPETVSGSRPFSRNCSECTWRYHSLGRKRHIVACWWSALRGNALGQLILRCQGIRLSQQRSSQSSPKSRRLNNFGTWIIERQWPLLNLLTERYQTFSGEGFSIEPLHGRCGYKD